MITRVAIQRGTVVIAGQPGERHDFTIDMGVEPEKCDVYGFITDAGDFLDREQAAKHALESGQISSPVQALRSEDLWGVTNPMAEEPLPIGMATFGGNPIPKHVLGINSRAFDFWKSEEEDRYNKA